MQIDLTEMEWLLTRLFHSDDALDAVEDYDRGEAILKRWRAEHGTKSPWRWYARWKGEESYGTDFATDKDAIANALSVGPPLASINEIEVVEACFWDDEIQPVDDELNFAEMRNYRVVIRSANDG